LEKTRCIRTRLPATPYPPTREIQILKIPSPIHIKSIPVPAEKKNKNRKQKQKNRKKKTKTGKKAKQKKKKPRICTRVRGTRVSETGTDMKQVGYSFEKKNVYPCPPYPSTRRACDRPTRRPPRSYPVHAHDTR
jgi:hypothetical protein